MLRQQLTRLTSAAAGRPANARTFFGYFRIAFNSLDRDRLREVGPDRLCAEWLVKNGASVTFAGRRPVDDYNALGSAEAGRRKLESVDASDASIMAIGFEHFAGCDRLRSIRLTRCKHMENEALGELGKYMGDRLEELTLVDCFNVTDEGLGRLAELRHLKRLEVSGVPYVKDLAGVASKLRSELPECDIKIVA